MHPSLTRLAQSAAAVSGLPFKRAQLGLFHGQTRSSGNNVPHSKQKTRRTWLPNIQNKHLVSEILGRKIEIKVTVKALKTMRKYGGLDQYLLKTKSDLLGFEGMRLRLQVEEALKAKNAIERGSIAVVDTLPTSGGSAAVV